MEITERRLSQLSLEKENQPDSTNVEKRNSIYSEKKAEEKEAEKNEDVTQFDEIKKDSRVSSPTKLKEEKVSKSTKRRSISVSPAKTLKLSPRERYFRLQTRMETKQAINRDRVDEVLFDPR